MVLLPEGFALPPLPYLLALAIGAGIVGWGLYRREATLDERRTLALAPWMVAGAGGHVLFVVEALPDVVAPLGGTPAVYVTAGVVAGAVWLVSEWRDADVALALAGVGSAIAIGVVAWTLGVGLARESLQVGWPFVGLVAGLGLGVVAWYVLCRVRPAVAATGDVGALVVVGHVLDAVSTSVGIDVLGFGERTPLSRYILEFAAELPTADVIGAGWLFVIVKIALAWLIVVLMVDYVRDRPGEGYALLALVAAVGLGPGVHNLLLFSVAGL